MKKTLNGFLYSFFKKELENAQEQGIITEKQVNDILANYEKSEGFNYVWVLGSVGALLIGLGFLLVVANSWEAIPNLLKLGILLVSFTAALAASHYFRDTIRYTSLALFYTSALIIGSGIFLVVDAYELGLEVSTQMYVWTLATLALSAYRKEIILFLFAHFLTFIFIVTGFDLVLFFHGVPLIAILYLGNHFFNHKLINMFVTLAISLLFIFYMLDYADLDSLYIFSIFFVLGFAMLYVLHSYNHKAFRVMGILTVGISGFALSFADPWSSIGLIDDGRLISIVFSIAFAVYLLYRLTKREIIPLLIVGALILRYYFDTIYDFLPRALFFVIGGLIILAIGLFIERLSNSKE